ITSGDRVALLSRNSWQFVAVSFAAARLGAVLVPVNFMLGAREIAYILEHSEATAFIAEDALIPTAIEAIQQSGQSVAVTATIRRSREQVPADWVDVETWCHSGGQPAIALPGDDDPLRLMYTSGTESRPKGVMLSSRSLLWQYVSCIVDGHMEPDDIELHSLPMYHCAQLDCFLGPDIYLGATSIIVPEPDPGLILRTIESE